MSDTPRELTEEVELELRGRLTAVEDRLERVQSAVGLLALAVMCVAAVMLLRIVVEAKREDRR